MASESNITEAEDSPGNVLDNSMVDESDRELQAEEETHQEQAKKIVEVDTVIAEKEEILTKLLDTVRGYSAMKVRAVQRSALLCSAFYFIRTCSVECFNKLVDNDIANYNRDSNIFPCSLLLTSRTYVHPSSPSLV